MIRRSLTNSTLDTKIHHERWLVSYADFITLLFAFFVVMYSVSQVSESKYRMLSETLSSTFAGAMETFESPTAESSTTDTLAEKTSTTGASDTAASLSPLDDDRSRLTIVHQRVQAALLGQEQQAKISMTPGNHALEIELSAGVLFELGSDRLSAAARSLLAPLVDVLAESDNHVAVEGHTDSAPISNDRFQSNWALSSLRAVAVVNALVEQGIEPRRLFAAGYGEHRPVADNSSAEGRGQNRRVVLRVHNVAVARRVLPGDGKSQTLGPILESPLMVNEASAPHLADEASVDNSLIESSLMEVDTPDNASVPPVRLRGGGLLFSSDPELPRKNPPIDKVSSPPADTGQ